MGNLPIKFDELPIFFIENYFPLPYIDRINRGPGMKRLSSTIWEFSNFRTFLVAEQQFTKQRKPHWNFALWASKLGLKDTSSLTKIIRGQRNPSEALTEKLVSYFAFNEKEAQYFRDLVRFEKLKSDDHLREELLERINRRNKTLPIRILDEKVFSVISNWYCLAIRELIKLREFCPNPNWIAKKFRFKVSPKQVSEAIESLLACQLLQRDDQGILKFFNGVVHSTNDIPSEAIKQYHEQMLDHARTAVREIDVSMREITSSTFAMPISKIPEAKDMIRKFKASMESMLSPPEEVGLTNSQVFQIQIQFFPLTKDTENEN
jgi:uncharacterized protein (TIGR02147 family)